jgi:hypothetical protein
MFHLRSEASLSSPYLDSAKTDQLCSLQTYYEFTEDKETIQSPCNSTKKDSKTFLRNKIGKQSNLKKHLKIYHTKGKNVTFYKFKRKSTVTLQNVALFINLSPYLK